MTAQNRHECFQSKDNSHAHKGVLYIVKIDDS